MPAEFFPCKDPFCKHRHARHAHTAAYIPSQPPTPRTVLMNWHFSVPNRYGRWTADEFADAIIRVLSDHGFKIEADAPPVSNDNNPSQGDHQ